MLLDGMNDGFSVPRGYCILIPYDTRTLLDLDIRDIDSDRPFDSALVHYHGQLIDDCGVLNVRIWRAKSIR